MGIGVCESENSESPGMFKQEVGMLVFLYKYSIWWGNWNTAPLPSLAELWCSWYFPPGPALMPEANPAEGKRSNTGVWWKPEQKSPLNLHTPV